MGPDICLNSVEGFTKDRIEVINSLFPGALIVHVVGLSHCLRRGQLELESMLNVGIVDGSPVGRLVVLLLEPELSVSVVVQVWIIVDVLVEASDIKKRTLLAVECIGWYVCCLVVTGCARWQSEIIQVLELAGWHENVIFTQECADTSGGASWPVLGCDARGRIVWGEPTKRHVGESIGIRLHVGRHNVARSRTGEMSASGGWGGAADAPLAGRPICTSVAERGVGCEYEAEIVAFIMRLANW